MKRLIPLFLIIFFLSLLSARTRRAPWYEQWAWNLVSPITSLFAWVQSNAKNLGSRYLFLVDAAKDEEQWRNKWQAARQKLVQLEELEQENERLTRLLELQQNRWPGGIAARVVAFDPRSEFRVIRIDKGSAEGVRSDLPVVAPEGLVGKVGPVFKRDALVLLLVDPTSFVDVVDSRSQVRCLLSGSGLLSHAQLKHGYFLTRLEYLEKKSDVLLGDTIVTSGLDGLYPKGILVGTITRLTTDGDGLFLKADLLPAVDFTKLKEVSVLKEY